MDLQLTGKRAVVTGGSRGIGFAIAQALVAEGVDVALVARDGVALDQARARLAASGRTVLGVVADTTDDESVRAMAARVIETLGGVDILVNAAATPAAPAPPRTLAHLRDAEIHAELDTKVVGYLRCARALAPSMIAAGWGRIINISGLAARQTGSITGSVRNVAVAALTKNLADELGRSGINVTVVHPGYTVTERTPGQFTALAATRGVTETEVEHAMGAATSIGRIVTAEEVADVVAFLASPRSVAITGDAIATGGGARGPIHY